MLENGHFTLVGMSHWTDRQNPTRFNQSRSNRRPFGLVSGSLAFSLSHMVAKNKYLHQGGLPMLALQGSVERRILPKNHGPRGLPGD